MDMPFTAIILKMSLASVLAACQCLAVLQKKCFLLGGNMQEW